MKFKKALSLLAAAAVLTGTVSGCSGKTQETSESSAETSVTAEETVEETVAETAAATAAETFFGSCSVRDIRDHRAYGRSGSRSG